MGRYYLEKISVFKLLRISISSSLVFFILSNFGVFVSSSIYTKDFNGLIICYIAAVPFFYGTLISSIIYTFSLFGVYEYILKYRLKLINND